MKFNVSNHHKKDERIGRLMPKKDTPRRRHIGMRHVVVGGVVLNQQRSEPGQCNYAGRFDDLGANCAGSELIHRPYGVDPVFLTTSTLYDEYIASRKALYYDVDDPTQADPLSHQPYGFRHVGSGFPIVLDINLDQASARKRVTYLKEGFYIDELTKGLTLDLLIYNGPSGLFASIQYDCKFQDSGLIKMDFNVNVFQVELYKGAAGTARLVLEVFFFIYILLDICGEAIELFGAWRAGSFFKYFKSVWNYLDIANLSLFVIMCIRWLMFTYGPAIDFDPRPRYNVYNDLQAGANYFDLTGSGQGLKEMMGVIEDANTIGQFFQTFRSNLMINIFLMTLRLFKNLDFQPRLRLVTATLENALVDLVHFLILFMLVLFIFGFSAYIILGQKIEQLSSPGSAFNACLALAFLGDTALIPELNKLTDPTLAAVAVFWFYSFIMLVNVLLLNILLAILVDAYVKVKELQGTKDVPSMFVELQTLLKTIFRGRLLNPRLQRNSVALANLKHLERVSGLFNDDDDNEEITSKREAVEFDFQGEKHTHSEAELLRAVTSFRASSWAKRADTESVLGKSNFEQTVHALFMQFRSTIEEPVLEPDAIIQIERKNSMLADMLSASPGVTLTKVVPLDTYEGDAATPGAIIGSGALDEAV